MKSLSDHLIYIQGKQTGTTNVILFDTSMKQIGILDVEVAIDTGNLQQNIRASTGTQGIRVSASEGQVVLSGTAADAVAAERAMAIATGTVPKGGVVVNAMSVAAPQQVMLEVRFLEVSRDLPVVTSASTSLPPMPTARMSVIRVLALQCHGRAGRQPIGGINTHSSWRYGQTCWCHPTGSLPLLGTVGTLGKRRRRPYGSIAHKHSQTQQRHVDRQSGDGVGDQGRGCAGWPSRT